MSFAYLHLLSYYAADLDLGAIIEMNRSPASFSPRYAHRPGTPEVAKEKPKYELAPAVRAQVDVMCEYPIAAFLETLSGCPF